MMNADGYQRLHVWSAPTPFRLPQFSQWNTRSVPTVTPNGFLIFAKCNLQQTKIIFFCLEPKNYINNQKRFFNEHITVFHLVSGINQANLIDKTLSRDDRLKIAASNQNHEVDRCVCAFI